MQSETVADFFIRHNSPMRHWYPLMEEWLLAIERYNQISKVDVPYWYTERANIGVLSGAAWRCGRVALEEFQHEKVEVNEDLKPEKENINAWNSRCDLWMNGEAGEGIVEAKFRSVNMLASNSITTAEASLQNALIDARATRGHPLARRSVERCTLPSLNPSI